MGSQVDNVPLFWTPKYLDLAPRGSFRWSPVIDEAETYNIPADVPQLPLISLRPVDQKLVSPAGASFGGFWAPETTLGRCRGNWTNIYSQLASSFPEFSDLEIFFPSDFFQPELFTPQKEELLSAGAEILEIDNAFYIEVEEWLPSESLNHGNRKKLRQQDEKNVTSFTVEHSELESVYKIIEENRAGMGVKPSLSFLQLQQQIENMPNNFQLFLTQCEGNNVASAVTVRLSPSTQYVLYWADTAEARSLSSVVGLCREIVSWCKTNGIKFLDLGGTNAHGVPNEGLMRFKTNLGAKLSPKTKVLLNLNEMKIT